MPRIICNSQHSAPAVQGGNLVHTLRSNPKNVSEDAPAFIRLDGKVLTRKQLDLAADQLAYAFVHSLGLKPGDRVAVLSINSTYYPVVMHACFSSGVVAVPISPAYGADELVHPFGDSDIRYVFVHPNQQAIGAVRVALEKIRHPRANEPEMVWLLSDTDVLSKGPLGEKDLRSLFSPSSPSLTPLVVKDAPNTTAVICYSSGTTGKSKGTVLTHGNLIAQIQLMPLIDPEAGPNRPALAVLPMYHIFALTTFMLVASTVGSPVVVAPLFALETFCAAIQRFKVKWVAVAPPILVLLAKSSDVDKYDLSSLQGAISGAAPLSNELAQQVEARFPNLSVGQGYGLTETSPVVSFADAREYSRSKYRGSAGKIAPGVEVRIVDTETREDVTDTQGQGINGGTLAGEIWVRGPSVFKAYLNNEEATKSSFPEPGWFATGDVGYVRDEWLYLTDRFKELIKTGGRQVAPAELEGILLDNPKVADAAVVPLFVKEKATEYPLAFIVPHPQYKDQKGLAEEVQKFVNDKVVFYKHLRGGVRIIDAIPKNPSGKLLRRVLRDQVRAEQEALEAKKEPKAKL